MKTIKLPIKLNKEDSSLLTTLRKQQSSVTRSSYKLFKDKNLSQLEIRQKLKNYNYPNLDSWFVQCGILAGKAIHNRFKDEKVIFGGKHNWIKYQKGLITKEDFKEKRLFPLNVEGESIKKGNRKFDLDIENHKIIFKPSRNQKIEIELPKLKKNVKGDLLKLQELANNKEVPYSVRLYNDNIFITFEVNEISRLKSLIAKRFTKKETREKAKEKLNILTTVYYSIRILGIDQYPIYIGISV